MTDDAKTFEPGVNMQQIRTAWNSLNNKHRQVLKALNGTNSRIATIAGIPDQTHVPDYLKSLFKRMGFLEKLDYLVHRAAAFQIYQVMEETGEMKPTGARAALIVYAFTGTKTSEFVSIDEDPYFAAEVAKPAAPKPAPPPVPPPPPAPPHEDPAPAGPTAEERAAAEAKTKVLLADTALISSFLPNVPGLNELPAIRGVLALGAQSLKDSDILPRVQIRDPGADLSTVERYFERAFTTLKIPDSYTYDERRALAIAVFQLPPPKIIEEEPIKPAKPEPKGDDVVPGSAKPPTGTGDISPKAPTPAEPPAPSPAPVPPPPIIEEPIVLPPPPPTEEEPAGPGDDGPADLVEGPATQDPAKADTSVLVKVLFSVTDAESATEVPAVVIVIDPKLFIRSDQDVVTLDSSSVSFPEDCQQRLKEGYEIVSGYMIVAPTGAFETRTILTLTRKRQTE